MLSLWLDVERGTDLAGPGAPLCDAAVMLWACRLTHDLLRESEQQLPALVRAVLVEAGDWSALALRWALLGDYA